VQVPDLVRIKTRRVSGSSTMYIYCERSRLWVKALVSICSNLQYL
jgi:hypothetical protein